MKPALLALSLLVCTASAQSPVEKIPSQPIGLINYAEYNLAPLMCVYPNGKVEIESESGGIAIIDRINGKPTLTLHGITIEQTISTLDKLDSKKHETGETDLGSVVELVKTMLIMFRDKK